MVKWHRCHLFVSFLLIVLRKILYCLLQGLIGKATFFASKKKFLQKLVCGINKSKMTTKVIQNSLDDAYLMKDSISKKVLAFKFYNYKMVDTSHVVE